MEGADTGFFLYFKRIFRLFRQLFSQMVVSPLAGSSLRGGGGGGGHRVCLMDIVYYYYRVYLCLCLPLQTFVWHLPCANFKQSGNLFNVLIFCVLLKKVQNFRASTRNLLNKQKGVLNIAKRVIFPIFINVEIS